MNFCPEEAKIQLLEKPRENFYKVSLIKTRLMFHKYHLLNQLQVFMTAVKRCHSQIVLNTNCTPTFMDS